MQITKSCPQCGSVEFKIKSFFESYIPTCNNCNKEVTRISLERYVKIEDHCSNCGNELFKAKIKKVNDKELWTIVCTKCGNTPRKYCSDEEGNEITYDKREKCLNRDEEEEVVLELNNTVDESYEIEEVINNLENEIDEREQEIKLLKNDIHSKDDEIRALKNELDDRDDEIQELNKRLLRYVNNMSELQEELDNLRKEYYY